MNISVLLMDVDRYKRDLLPAYRSFMNAGETLPLLNKLEEARTVASALRSQGNHCLFPDEVYREHQDILSGKIALHSLVDSPTSIEQFVAESIGWELLDALCLRRDLGFEVEQSMSDPDLAELLYGSSSWIEDMFTGVLEPTGPQLEIRFGEWSKLFALAEVSRFQMELANVPQQLEVQATAKALLNLSRLVKIANTDDRYGLLYTVF